MKVIFLGRYNKSEKLNGPEKFAKRLFKGISALNPNSLFIEHYFKGNGGSILKRIFGKEKISVNPRIQRNGFFRLFLFLVKNQPDIIHIVTHERFIIPVFFYRIFLRSRIIITHHSIVKEELNNSIKMIKKYSRFKDLLFERLSYKCADMHVFVSETLYLKSKEYYSFDQKDVIIIPNGVDEIFRYEDRTFDNKAILKILFYNGFGNIFPRGLEYIINALNEVYPKNLFELIVLGNADATVAPKFNLTSMKQLGSDELAMLMRETDIFLKSNEFDSFSMMALEAMTAGMIVIVSTNVGVKEYIRNGINGFVYDKNNQEELTKLINEILCLSYDLNSISQQATQIQNTLSWKNVCNMYSELYKR